MNTTQRSLVMQRWDFMQQEICVFHSRLADQYAHILPPASRQVALSGDGFETPHLRTSSPIRASGCVFWPGGRDFEPARNWIKKMEVQQ